MNIHRCSYSKTCTLFTYLSDSLELPQALASIS